MSITKYRFNPKYDIIIMNNEEKGWIYIFEGKM